MLQSNKYIHIYLYLVQMSSNIESPRVQWRLSSVSPTVSVPPDSVQ